MIYLKINLLYISLNFIYTMSKNIIWALTSHPQGAAQVIEMRHQKEIEKEIIRVQITTTNISY